LSRSRVGSISHRRFTRSSKATVSSFATSRRAKIDYHRLSYYHCNVDSDQIMFYVAGDYEARKGSGLGQGSVSVHPASHAHGPQSGAYEHSIGTEFFDELAVMVDTFRPWSLVRPGARPTTASTPGHGPVARTSRAWTAPASPVKAPETVHLRCRVLLAAGWPR
jgi:hypothetical protein